MLHITPLITAYLILLAALLGLVMGSFLTCLAMRSVSGASVLRGRSHCDSCGHVLGVPDLVPVFSWLFSRGRCRYCGVKLPAKYPALELLCGVIYVSLLLRFDVTWDLALYAALMTLLFPASLVDLDIQELPDGFLLAAAVAFFPLAWLAGGLPLIVRGLIGAVALFVPMLLIVLLFDKLMGRETMGGGDLKLIAVLGLYFGWQQGVLLIILACLLGLLMALLTGSAKARTAFPFGPALSAAAWLTALIGSPVLSWYTSLF